MVCFQQNRKLIRMQFLLHGDNSSSGKKEEEEEETTVLINFAGMMKFLPNQDQEHRAPVAIIYY